MASKEVQVGAPALIIKPVKVPALPEGNYDEVEKYLTGVAAKYKDLVFDESSIAQAKAIKSELVTLRTSLKSITDTVKKERFNGPKDVFQTKMDSLAAIVGKVEKQIDEALAAEDQKRIDEINEALDAYKGKLQEEFNLPPEYMSKIEYRKNYYNVTQKEKDTRDDLREQFEDQLARHKERKAAVRLIRDTIGGDLVINLQEQIDKLDRGMGLAAVIEWIKGEKERLESLRNPKPAEEEDEDEDDEVEEEVEEEVEDDDDDAEVGVVESGDAVAEARSRILAGARARDWKTDFAGKTKTIKFSIEYPVDLGPVLKELFIDLERYGIITKAVKE